MDTNSLTNIINGLDSVNVNDDTIPQWALLMLKGMKFLLNGFQEISELKSKVDALESFKTVNEQVTKSLQDDNITLHEKISKLENRIDDQEQRSRNGCLLFHGVTEVDDENTDTMVVNIVKDLVGVNDFTVDEIQRSHRLGPKSQARSLRSKKSNNRAIIVRFTNYRTRNTVFKSKKNLKGQNIVITENLTRTRYELFKNCAVKLGKNNVWTNEGRIMSMVNGHFTIISSIEELNSL